MFRIFAARAAGELRRLRRERELRDREAKLSALIDSAMDGIVELDGNLRVVSMNAASESMFGCRESEWCGRAPGSPIWSRILPRKALKPLEISPLPGSRRGNFTGSNAPPKAWALTPRAPWRRRRVGNDGAPRWPLYLLAHFIAVTIWRIAEEGLEERDRPQRLPWLLGVGLTLMVGMLAMTYQSPMKRGRSTRSTVFMTGCDWQPEKTNRPNRMKRSLFAVCMLSPQSAS